MLTRRIAAPLSVALMLALTPPLATAARAAGKARPGDRELAVQFGRDLGLAMRRNQGKGVKIALISGGVAVKARTLGGRVEEEHDLMDGAAGEQIEGTVFASLLVGQGSRAAPTVMDGFVPDSTLLPIRAYVIKKDSTGRHEARADLLYRTIGDGIRYAADHGAGVIAVNMATGDPENRLRAAVVYAQRRNAVVVAPAALQTKDDPVFPGVLPGVIAVGAVNESGRRQKDFTDPSSAVLVAAPGARMPVMGPGGKTYEYWGDGPAVAWATATATMVRSAYPKLSGAQVGRALAASARHPDGKGGYDADLGFGYINPVGALEEAERIAGEPPLAPSAKSSVKDAAHLGAPPGTIRAVPYDRVRLGGFGGLILAGLVALGVAGALVLRRVRGRRRPGRSGPVAPEPPASPESTDAVGT